jgi:crotonobetainyl-CoA:carnitine CoA-transferase CaiB-like acyl-CoA transferase
MVTGQSLLAALYARTVTGEGAYIDISMFDCFVWWNSLLDSRWCFNGGECKRDDLEYPSTAYNVYDTKDGGKLALGMVEPKFWEPFCDAIGHPEIKPDGLKRRWEAPESFTKVEETIKSKTTDEWVEWLEDKDFCIAKVNSKSEAVEQITRENPEALAWVEFPRVGRVLQTGLPHHISTIPVEISEFTEVSPLGADTAEYLKKVGADDATIERLKGEGGIRLGDDIEPEEDRAPVKPA